MKPGLYRWIPIISIGICACNLQAFNNQSGLSLYRKSETPIISTLEAPGQLRTYTPSLIKAPTQIPFPTFFLIPIIEKPTMLIACDLRYPATDDLYVEVSASYGLAADYVPGDLVRLGDYIPGRVTLPEMLLRRVAAIPLGKMIKEMLAVRLNPIIVSSYRSYYNQAVVHQRWVVEDPAHANQVSALPGHSEHQLGTVVDFSSPELLSFTGSPTIKLSPLFANSGEGIWLANHAFEYGFTMSSPPAAEVLTGLAYEPWHYRYVGLDLATYLHKSGYYLNEYLLEIHLAMPCIP